MKGSLVLGGVGEWFYMSKGREDDGNEYCTTVLPRERNFGGEYVGYVLRG